MSDRCLLCGSSDLVTAGYSFCYRHAGTPEASAILNRQAMMQRLWGDISRKVGTIDLTPAEAEWLCEAIRVRARLIEVRIADV